MNLFKLEFTCKNCNSKDVNWDIKGYTGDAIIEIECNNCGQTEEEIF